MKKNVLGRRFFSTSLFTRLNKNGFFKLFCSRADVISGRQRETNAQTICDRMESTFLMQCASSMMMYSKLNFLKAR